MDTVTVTRTFGSDLEGMVARCRTLESRQVWPGAVPKWETHEKLYYQVSMRLKAATLTDIELEETLGPVEHEGIDTVFRTTQRCTWPDGVADGSTEYRFTPGTPNRIQFTYAYEHPTTKLVKTKDLPRFREGMERVATVYLDALTGVAVGAH